MNFIGATTIGLDESTRDELASLKRGGESFDDLVLRLTVAARAERPGGSLIGRFGREGHGEWDMLEHVDYCPDCRREDGEPAAGPVALSLVKKFETGGMPYDDLVAQHRARIATLRPLEEEGFEPVGPDNDPVLWFEKEVEGR